MGLIVLFGLPVRRWLAWAVLGPVLVGLVVSLVGGFGAPAANAAGPEPEPGAAVPGAGSVPALSVLVSQTTGTGPFDADDAPGHDSSASNDVVRTNDLINYKVEVRYENEDGATPSKQTTFKV